jgi:membrane protease YdiL (CAAX protease family)
MRVEREGGMAIVAGVSRLLVLPVFLLVVFAGGGLVAPWVWWGMQALARGVEVGWVQDLAAQPFLRYVHRCVLGLALIGLWPFARMLGARTAGDVGLVDPGRVRSRWLGGFGIGALMFALTLAFEVGVGGRSGREGLVPGRLAWMMANAAVSGAVVGALEEILFRGVLCRGMADRVGWGVAIPVSSVVYAWSHFLGRGVKPESVEWSTGLEVVTGMVGGSLGGWAMFPGLPTLTLAGVLLACVLRDTGSLYASMGLHTGWVFWIKMRGALTVQGIDLGGGWSESRVSAGWPGLVAVMLALGVYPWWGRWIRGRGQRGIDPPDAPVIRSL